MIIVKNFRINDELSECLKEPIDFELPNKGLITICRKYHNFTQSFDRLISCLTLANSNYDGEIFYNKKNIKDFTKNEEESYKNNIVYLKESYHNPKVFYGYTVLEAFLEANVFDEGIIKEALDKVGLNIELKRKTSKLNNYEKELLELAIALANNPIIIFISKFTMEDSQLESYYKVLESISKDYLIVIGTHYETFIPNNSRIIIFNPKGILSDNGDSLNQDMDINDSSFNEIIVSKSKEKSSIKDNLQIGKKAGFIIKNIPLFVLLVFSFILIGISTAYMFYNPAYTLNFLYSSDEIKELNLYKEYTYRIEEYDIDKEGNKTDKTQRVTILDDNNIVIKEGLASEFDKTRLGYYSLDELNELNKNSVGHVFLGKNIVPVTDFIELDDLYYMHNFTCICEGTQEFFDQYNIPTLAGTYPKTYDEIAISSYMADGLIESLNDPNMTYESLIGQYTDCKIYGASKTLKISGIYDFGKINSKYDSIKGITNEEYENMSESDRYNFITLYKTLQNDLSNQFGLLYCFAKEGFCNENHLNLSPVNFHVKCCHLGAHSAYCVGYKIGNHSNFTDSFIPFEEVVQSKDYVFFDFNGNVIESPSLDNTECYLPYNYYYKYKDNITDYYEGFKVYPDSPITFDVKGFFKGPTADYINMALNTEAVINLGYTIEKEYYEKYNTKYQNPENACYHYLVTFSNYSLKQTMSIYNYPTNNFKYVTSAKEKTRIEHAVSFNETKPIWLFSIGMGLLFISLYIILSRNFDIKKRYTNSKNNLMKTPNILKPYVLYTIITIVISFLISIAGTYLGCFIINSSDYYSIRILFFNGYGYLLMIGIALITCGISLLVLFRKKKTNKV